MHVNVSGASIARHSPNKAAAVRFLEYLVSDEGQEHFVTETYEYPVVEGIANPEGVPPLDELEGPDLDLTDLESLEESQALLTELGLLG